MGVASSRPVMSTTAIVMAAIPMVTVEAGLEVTLVVPPLLVAEEERRETELPVSSGEGEHGSPAWSELVGSGGAMAKTKVEQPPVSRGVLVADIPFDGEEDTGVEPPAIPPSWELVMIRSSLDTTMAGSSSRSGATREMVWPCPGEPGKAWFVLHDEEEVKLWHLLGEEDYRWSPISRLPRQGSRRP